MIVEIKSKEYDKELDSVMKTIQIKLREFEGLNRRLNQMIDAAGGAETDPTEGRVKNYELIFNQQ